MSIIEVEIAGQKLIIHELDDVCDPLTGRALTGSWVWDSSLVLSEWMATQGRVEFDLQSKTVIELGAGTGIPGLTAVLLGAGRVILTDIAPLLPGLQKNVDENGLGERVEVKELVWGRHESWTSGLEVDLVLMSDVFYDPSEMAALAATLKRVCGMETRIWSASEIRAPTHECLDELEKEGFEVSELENRVGRASSASVSEDERSTAFAVFRLGPKGTLDVNRKTWDLLNN